MTPPNKLEQLAEFKDAIQSNKGLERLRAMQYLQQMNNQGLMGMPQVTEQPVIQRQGGGKVFNNLDEATAANLPPNSKFFIVDDPDPYFVDSTGAIGKEIQEGITGGLDAYTAEDIEDGTVTEEKAIAYRNYLRDLEQSNQDRSQYDRRKIAEQYGDLGVQGRADGGQVSNTAQGLAGLGRYGDNMLLHINPEELQGLASMGKITYNPITGLPEAWGFRSFFKPFKQAARSIKKVAKSKAFRMLAPLALTIAAPYLAASFFPATFGVGSSALMAGGLSAQVAAMGPIAFGAATAIGSGLGALAAGAKPKDALKAAAMSGITAGGMRGFTNYMDPNIDSVWGSTYKGANAAGQAADTAGKVGNLTTSFGDVGTPAPSIDKVARTGADFGQYGSTDSLVAPDYYQDFGIAGDIPVGAPGGVPTAPVPSGTNVYANVVPPSFDPSTATYSAGQAATPDAYSSLYGPSTTGQATSGVGDVANRLSPGAGDQSYTVGGDYNYTAPTLKEQAMDALTDNKLGRAVSRAGDYLEGTRVGDIGKAIYDDYSTGTGLAKLVATDAMIPDYQEQYAMEDERKRQLEELEKLGYSVDLSDADTGFNQTVVIRDSSGRVMPSNLSIQDILDRALGRTPRTRLRDRIDFAPATAKHGGLVNLAHGGEFSGKVEGDGHGMEDNVYMPIKEGGEQVGTLAVSPSEYVVDAYTMSALGNGNADEGAKVMDGVVESVRKKAYGTIRQPKEIDGLMALKPMMAGV